MSELPILYVDGFEATLSPWGAFLRFGARAPGVPGANSGLVFQEVARLAMGLPHLKVLATVLVREVLVHEKALGHRIEVPDGVLESVKLVPQDWARFWGLEPKPEAALVTPGGALALAPR